MVQGFGRQDHQLCVVLLSFSKCPNLATPVRRGAWEEGEPWEEGQGNWGETAHQHRIQALPRQEATSGYVRPPSEGCDALAQPPVISHLEYCNTLRPTKVLPECITPSNPGHRLLKSDTQSLALATMRQTALWPILEPGPGQTFSPSNLTPILPKKACYSLAAGEPGCHSTKPECLPSWLHNGGTSSH
ncbi:unnamed protein product [Boreogadus saida]